MLGYFSVHMPLYSCLSGGIISQRLSQRVISVQKLSFCTAPFSSRALVTYTGVESKLYMIQLVQSYPAMHGLTYTVTVSVSYSSSPVLVAFSCSN